MITQKEASGRRRRGRGFTMIELMMVVSVVGILAAIAMPKFADMIQKTQEGALKGNLGALRSALSIYQADNQGTPPSCVSGADSNVFTISLVPTYIAKVPVVKNGLHPAVDTVYCDAEMEEGSIHDGQGWYYDGTVPVDGYAGGVWVACDHTDLIGKVWTAY